MNTDRLLHHEPSPHDHPEHPEKPQRSNSLRRLAISLSISAAVMGLEMVGGWISGSLALVADATHMMADTFALGMALFAAWLAARPKTLWRSYGYYRLEVLAALFNGLLLLGIATYLIIEALDRWNAPHEIDVAWMLGIGVVGLVANLIMMSIMRHSHDHSINMRAAFLHVMGDALSSVAVIVGAIVMLVTGIVWPDLIASFFVAMMIIIMAVRLLRDSIHVLLEGTPRHMNPEIVQKEIYEKFKVVRDIHDLHIWEITSHLFAMTAHIEAEVKGHEDTRLLIDGLNSFMRDKYGVGHTTFQVEPIQKKPG